MTRLYLNATDFSIPVLSPNTHWQTKNSQCLARQRQEIQTHIVFEQHEQSISLHNVSVYIFVIHIIYIFVG